MLLSDVECKGSFRLGGEAGDYGRRRRRDWNVVMQTAVSSQPPYPQARFAAITQLAVFEAVNAIRRAYEPYLGTVEPLKAFSGGIVQCKVNRHSIPRLEPEQELPQQTDVMTEFAPASLAWEGAM
jgi:hypothetical protein